MNQRLLELDIGTARSRAARDGFTLGGIFSLSHITSGITCVVFGGLLWANNGLL